jgi:hypothetical protein
MVIIVLSAGGCGTGSSCGAGRRAVVVIVVLGQAAGAKRASASRAIITRIGTLAFMGHLQSPDLGSGGPHLLILIRLRRRVTRRLA